MSQIVHLEQSRKFEKIKTSIFNDTLQASEVVATKIAETIKGRASINKHVVLGLATGSTGIKVYEHLVSLHKNDGLRFSNVITFNLDEYFPMQPNSIQSYRRFMDEHLFNHVDIKKENIHIPDGTINPDQVVEYCRAYEDRIDKLGGIDLQILGIGRSGHIGFNEPGSSVNSKTRLIILDKITRTDAASEFFGEENVPHKAITMGVSTILKAGQIILMSWGESKSFIIKESVEGKISHTLPATYLQEHPNVEIVLDRASAAELTRVKTPWLVGSCEWDHGLRKKAVIWLSQKTNKAILKLTREDYIEFGMGELLEEQVSAEIINVEVFNEIQHTITGWPGGKPDADDSQRPVNANPYPKRVLVFSPHPDDDVISMGGTLIRLVEQGHDVHIAYQTSGNISVADDDALRFVDFAVDFNKKYGQNKSETESIFEDLKSFMAGKEPGEVDLPEIQEIKGMIRKGEARAACRYCKIKKDNVHFLEMPFYETGRVKKKPLDKNDIQVIIDLLNNICPNQIYAAGDLSDPHGTHRVCLDAIYRAIKKLEGKADWLKDASIWLYRGAWQEWDIGEIQMAVPIGPRDMMRKRKAIFKHQSQKDKALFPGHDDREFWQRAEDRNKTTAKAYNSLGLSEYEAIEAFVKSNEVFKSIDSEPEILSSSI